jgi:hypothetical protein
MSPIYGDITLINGRILNLKSELGTSLPTFNSNDVGRLFFVSTDGTLRVNDGNEWVTIQFSNTENSSPLLVTLGTNWINNDLSFNPTPFNDLDNISGLTANSTLYSVIAALDAAITGLSSQHLADLGDTAFGSLAAGDIVIWSGTAFTNISLNNLAESRLTLNTTSLKDVTQLDAYVPGDVLVFSASEEKFANRQVSYTYTNTATDSEFLISHQLGVRYPLVQIINYATNTSITTGYSISYDGANELTLTLDTAAPVIVIVYAINGT